MEERHGDREGRGTIEVEVVEVVSPSALADGPPRSMDEPGFGAWIRAGWRVPLETGGRSSAIGRFELVSGDGVEMICTRGAAGPEALMVFFAGGDGPDAGR